MVITNIYLCTLLCGSVVFAIVEVSCLLMVFFRGHGAIVVDGSLRVRCSPIKGVVHVVVQFGVCDGRREFLFSNDIYFDLRIRRLK